jgi:hypothetical protein
MGLKVSFLFEYGRCRALLHFGGPDNLLVGATKNPVLA